MAQTLYPRTVSVNRAETVAAGNPNIGLLGYSGLAQGVGTGTLGEIVVLTGVSCSIQAQGMGRVKGQGLLPGDAPGPGQWHVFIPFTGAAKASINDRDVLVDDEGIRYQVSQAHWDSLGYKLICIRLEA